MFSLHLTYLTGRAVATAYDDRRAAEWPPHPARVYSALVDAWADGDPPDEAERAALTWLEGLAPPVIKAGGASPRDVSTTFVPVNDVSVVSQPDRQREGLAVAEAGGNLARIERARQALRQATAGAVAPICEPTKEDAKRALQVMPETRLRQGRTFPSVGLEDPEVWFCWDADPSVHIHALAGLAARLVRVGHSSSLVSARVERTAPPPTLVPDDSGDLVLRVTGFSQLDALVDEHERHQGIEPRVLPCRFQRYRRASQIVEHPVPISNFDDRWLVFRRVGGDRLPIVRAVDLATAIRAALVECAPGPVPAVLHGHGSEGGPTEQPHLAVVSLPFVGRQHADGSLLGAALILPREVEADDRRAVLQAIAHWEQKRGIRDGEESRVLEIGFPGSAVRVELERVVWGGAPQVNLRPGAWCGPARTWVSATPVALDRNPGDMNARDPAKQRAAWDDAAESIAAACERIGLPRPVEVAVLPSVSLQGTSKALRHPPYPPRQGRVRRVKTHARLVFAEEVRGPVLLGAGRFLGLGLFRPMNDEGGDDVAGD